MKKRLSVILSVVIALSAVVFASCGNDTHINETDSTTASTQVIETTVVTESTTAQPTTVVEETTVTEIETKSTEKQTQKPTEKPENKNDNKTEDKKENSSSVNNNSNNNSNSSVKKKNSLSLSKTSLTLKEGESKTITINYTTNSNSYSYNVNINNSNAKVECSGTTITVYGNRGGKSVLTVEDSNGKKAVCNITVKAKTSSSSTVVNNPYQAYANEILNLVNKERTNNGLPKLTLKNNITAIANERAKEIVTRYSHTRPDGTKVYESIVFDWGMANTAAENIAKGQTSPSQVMNDWMNSQTHRNNILNSNFNGLGVGYYESGGICYWVQIFVG